MASQVSNGRRGLKEDALVKDLKSLEINNIDKKKIRYSFSFDSDNNQPKPQFVNKENSFQPGQKIKIKSDKPDQKIKQQSVKQVNPIQQGLKLKLQSNKDGNAIEAGQKVEPPAVKKINFIQTGQKLKPQAVDKQGSVVKPGRKVKPQSVKGGNTIQSVQKIKPTTVKGGNAIQTRQKLKCQDNQKPKVKNPFKNEDANVFGMHIYSDDINANETPVKTIDMSENSKMTRILGLDCEMVGTGSKGQISILARVSIVNQFGQVLYDKFVATQKKVTDYRTAISGVRPCHLQGAPSFKTVQAEVARLIKGHILVGHSINNDLRVLFLDHPKELTRDTAKYKPFKAAFNGRTPSLKSLAKKFLGMSVQGGEHSSVEDSQAAVRLYLMFMDEWEVGRKCISTGKKSLKGKVKELPTNPISKDLNSAAGLSAIKDITCAAAPASHGVDSVEIQNIIRFDPWDDVWM